MTQFLRRASFLAISLPLVVLVGCGSTKSRTATEQLIVSDAVDRSVSKIDFSALRDQTVYLDTDYIKGVKGVGFVNSEYIISSMRNQMAAAGCLLQEKPDEAEFVVEARVGSLGMDESEVIYGIPANNALNSAATLVPNAPPLPAIPEISVGKRHSQKGAAKILAFAYRRETREPVWQSGVAQSESNSKDIWVFGAGPFQSGTIYDRTEFAGSQLGIPGLGDEDPSRSALASYSRSSYFDEDLKPGAAEEEEPEAEERENVAELPDDGEEKEEETSDDAKTVNYETPADEEQAAPPPAKLSRPIKHAKESDSE